MRISLSTQKLHKFSKKKNDLYIIRRFLYLRTYFKLSEIITKGQLTLKHLKKVFNFPIPIFYCKKLFRVMTIWQFFFGTEELCHLPPYSTVLEFVTGYNTLDSRCINVQTMRNNLQQAERMSQQQFIMRYFLLHCISRLL